MPTKPPAPSRFPTSEPAPVEAEIPIDSRELFKGRREVVIRHNQERYVLRITRQGKLILNK